MDNELREVLMAPSILGSLGAAVYFFTKTMTDYVLKKKMIEKGYVSEESQAIFKQEGVTNRYGSLKWGLLFLSGGLALILLSFIDTRPDSPLPYGLLTVFISAGFLVYYWVVSKGSNGTT